MYGLKYQPIEDLRQSRKVSEKSLAKASAPSKASVRFVGGSWTTSLYTFNLEKPRLVGRAVTPINYYLRSFGFKVSYVPSIEDLKLRGKSRDVYAVCDEGEKKITIAYRHWKTGKLLDPVDLLFLLAHETRHVMHIRKKLFHNYYFKRLVSQEEGLVAEVDCDRWAAEYVRRTTGKETRFAKRRYPSRKVAGAYELDVLFNLESITSSPSKAVKRLAVLFPNQMASILGKIKRTKKPKAYDFFDINYSDDDSGFTHKILLIHDYQTKILTLMGKFQEITSGGIEKSGPKE